jgi:hypothetical protein
MANYFVIGADGKQYGPVATEDLRKWVAEGRADQESQVRLESATEWTRLSQIPELSATPGNWTPPPLPREMIAPPAAAPAFTPEPEGRLSGLAVTSLILGILGPLLGLTAVLGLIFGIIALIQIRKSNGALRGWGLALAGTIVSGVVVLIAILALAFLMFANVRTSVAATENHAQDIECVNNEKQLAIAIRMYNSDHGDKYPPAATWCDAILASAGDRQVFHCPLQPAALDCGYAYNAKLDGLSEDTVNSNTVVLFESDTGWNAHGAAGIAIARHGHDGTSVTVALADGRVQTVPQSELSSLRWDP